MLAGASCAAMPEANAQNVVPDARPVARNVVPALTASKLQERLGQVETLDTRVLKDGMKLQVCRDGRGRLFKRVVPSPER